MRTPGCVACGKESSGVVHLAENVHEMACSRCQDRWAEVPLVGTLGGSALLAQWRDFVFRVGRR